MSTLLTENGERGVLTYAVVIRAQCAFYYLPRSQCANFTHERRMATPKAAPRRPWIWFAQPYSLLGYWYSRISVEKQNTAAFTDGRCGDEEQNKRTRGGRCCIAKWHLAAEAGDAHVTSRLPEKAITRTTAL
ncbi:hypothetical protein KCP70_15035 [Salmonella enterica subsp. enterica]|nr:hypothetical protein KCP70_15035 [Salmonella enterica subsp. enterica]